MEGDVSPQVSQESDGNADVPPTGDLAILTANVMQTAETGASRGPATVPTVSSSAKTTAYPGRGKGVGKGQSGSSGPPVKRRKAVATTTRPCPPSDEESDDDNNEEGTEMATQTITVHSRRGYTSYPAYMFDIPPRKLKTDNLRKKLMIQEIKNSKAQEMFYKCGIEMMGVMKEFFRAYTAVNNFPGQEGLQGDHGYAMPDTGAEQNQQNNTGDTDGEDEV